MPDQSHEIVIRFGRPFDVQVRGAFGTASEITVPFANRESAEAAQREITVSVRPVHDAGGEDYRPVVAGEVIRQAAKIESGERVPDIAADVREAQRRIEAGEIADTWSGP